MPESLKMSTPVLLILAPLHPCPPAPSPPLFPRGPHEADFSPLRLALSASFQAPDWEQPSLCSFLFEALSSLLAAHPRTEAQLGLPSCSGRFVDTPSPVPVCLVTDVRPDSSLELRPAQGLLSEPAGAVHLERCLP